MVLPKNPDGFLSGSDYQDFRGNIFMRDARRLITYKKLYHYLYGLEDRNAFYDKKFVQGYML